MRREQFLILGTVALFSSILFTLSGCRLLSGNGEDAIMPLITEPAPAAAFENQRALMAATIPERDLVELARRLGGQQGEIARTVTTAAALSQGAITPFWYKNHATDEAEQIEARLAYRSDQLNLWIEAGAEIDEPTLQQAATVLEDKILPTNRAFFGEEWQPGIDGDARLNILHLRDIGGNVVGYFSAADEFVTEVNPYSNQREMFYISLKHAPVGSDDYYEVIAHEMQHMIHWHRDSNEATWVDEGLAVLAATLNGYTGSSYDQAYALRPDVQLNHFDYESEATTAHYGAAFLFTSYFLDRFGQAATQALVRHPENGIQGVEATLAEMGTSLSFDDLFADWLGATYLDGRERGYGNYVYKRGQVPLMEPEVELDRLPQEDGLASVHQYGADYIAVKGNEPVTFVFTGTQQVQLLESDAYSGDYFWTTVPGDDSDMTLTGRFDLSGLTQASLTFWSWYDIEVGWDYAYITVSTDGGTTWQLLETDHTTEENPQGNSYGPALTGKSGGGETPAWVQQRADLTPYTGGPISVRFEYVTDDAVHRQGLALDEIAIPELDFRDDAESGEGVWEAAGFVRHSNVLPQQFLVQQILLGPGQVEVTRLPLDENQQGRWALPLGEGYDEAILIVAGKTPVTTLRATYAYSLEEQRGARPTGTE